MSKTLKSDLFVSEMFCKSATPTVHQEDRGEHLLRGVETPMRLYHVVSDRVFSKAG
jgi:hypothetical protein